MNLLLTWLVLAIAVWIAAAVVPGIKVQNFGGAIIAAAIFGVVNWLLGWLLFTLIGLGTLGLGFLLAFLTRWIVDAIILMITGKISRQIAVRGFGSALLGSLLMSAIGTFGEYLLR